MLRALRGDLARRNFVEVSTPALCSTPDVATMAQFRAEHPALSESWLLRIAPTENLKRLIALGLPTIFEVSTNFRGDPPDNTHLSEFTALEVMCAHANCREMQGLTVDLLRVALEAVAPFSTSPVRLGSVREVRTAALLEGDDLSVRVSRDDDGALRDAGTGHLLTPEQIDALVSEGVAHLPGPVFVTEFPWTLGGPATPCTHDGSVKERAELFVDGVEIANMSSTLFEPSRLRLWHEEGVVAKAKLGIEPNYLDEGLLKALADLPPSAVTGFGVERVLALGLGLPDIRQVSLAHLLTS